MKFVKYKLIPRKNGMHIAPNIHQNPRQSIGYDFETIVFPLDMLDFHVAVVSDDFPVQTFSAHHMQEITRDDAISIARLRDPDATISDEGALEAPNLFYSTPDTDS